MAASLDGANDQRSSIFSGGLLNAAVDCCRFDMLKIGPWVCLRAQTIEVLDMTTFPATEMRKNDCRLLEIVPFISVAMTFSAKRLT